MLTRIAGLLLAAIAVQLIADAVAAFVHSVHRSGLTFCRTGLAGLPRALLTWSARHTPVPEQLGFAGMPERLFVCTPSKLGAFVDCPRRYRYHLRRPADPAERRALGAQLARRERAHGSEKLVCAVRRPARAGCAAHAAQGDLGARGLSRRRAGTSDLPAGPGLAGVLRGDARPADEPLGVERVVATKTAVLAFNGRADRIDSRPGPDGPEAVIVDYKTGRSGMDADDARGSQALALYAYAAAARVPPPVPPGRAASPADRHGGGARAHRRVAGPAGVPGRGHGPRHHGRGESGGGRRGPGRRSSRPTRAPLCRGATSGAAARPARRPRPRSPGPRWRHLAT